MSDKMPMDNPVDYDDTLDYNLGDSDVPMIETEEDLEDLAESYGDLEELLDGIEAYHALQVELGGVGHRDRDYWG